MVASRTLIQLAAAAVLFALVVPSVVQSAAAGGGSGIQWKVSDLFYGRPAVASDGSVYVLMSKLNTDGTKTPVGLRALDPDGNKRWEAPVSGACYDPVVDANGTVYYTEISRNSYDSDLVAISADGVPLWRVNSSEVFPTKRFSSFSSPVVSADGNVLVTFDDRLEFGQGESRLCSFRPDGSMSWSTRIVHNQTRMAVGGEPGSMIYAISLYGQVQGLFPNGTMAWTVDLSGRGLMVDSPAKVSHDGGLYLIMAPKDNETGWLNYSALREVWSISPNGSLAWTFVPLAGMEGASGCTVVVSGVSEEGDVYIGQQAGVEVEWIGNQSYDTVPVGLVPASVMALDRDGRLEWKNVLPENLTLSLPVITTDAAVYAFTLDEKECGGITAFSTSNGSLLGSYASPTELWVSGMAAGSGDRIYYFEGTYKGAEQGTISLIFSVGLPMSVPPRPLDLPAAALAWSSVIGLAAVSGFFATRKKGT